jgi:hypothetical protein
MITTINTALQAVAAAPWDGFSDCQQEQSVWTGWMNPGECIESPAGTVASAIGNEVVQPWVDDIKNGVASGVKTMVSFWVAVPDPAISSPDGTVSETVGFLQTTLNPLVAIIMCFTVLGGIIAIVVTNKGEHFRNIVEMIATYIVVTGLLAVSVGVGLDVINWASQELITRSTEGTSFADNIAGLFNTTEGVGSAVLLIIFLVIAALISALTCILMIARGGILICLVGAASLGNALGRATMRTMLAWITAFSFYKLAAAIVYAVGFRLIGSDTTAAGNGFLQILYGLTLLGMAVLALPACIRLIVPLIAPVAQGRGAGAGALGAGVAMGTMLVRR